MKLSQFKYFYPERPVLITVDQPLFEILSTDTKWVAERKYDENRLQLHLLNGRWEFWNRHGARFDYKPGGALPEALEHFRKRLPGGYCLFDGGLRHNKVPGVSHQIVLYDTFIFDGRMLIGRPFWYRRNIITGHGILADDGEILFPEQAAILVPDQVSTGFRAYFDRVSQEPETEGLVIKKLTGQLDLGRKAGINSSWMYKVRRPSGRYLF